MPFRQIAETCRRRGGSGCGGVSAMDGATELTGTYLQRPPQPDPLRHPKDRPLLPLPLPLIRQVQGAACRQIYSGINTNPSGYTIAASSALTSKNPTPCFSARSCTRPCARSATEYANAP